MTNLPSGWAWATLGEVAHVASDLTSPADHPDLPHIAPNHIESKTGRLLPYRSVSEDGVTSPKHRFYSGQVLYSKIRPYLAKATIAPTTGLCSADMYPISSPLHPPYLLRWMLSDVFTELTSHHQGRSLLPKINAKALMALPIPVPPLAEQLRITFEAEALSDAIAQGNRNLAIARRRLKALQYATETRLLLDFPRVKLREVVNDTRYGTSVRCSYDSHGGVPVLRIPNITAGSIDQSDLKYAPASELSNIASFALEESDILVVRTNGSRDLIGRSAIARGVKGMAYASYLIRCRVEVSRLLPEWLNLALSTIEVRRQIESRAASSAGQFNLSAEKLLDLEIPLPRVSEQRDLVYALEDLNIESARTRDITTSIFSRSSHLLSAVNAAACEGQLVPQNVRDEPASLLLERIRAGRSVAVPAKAAGRRPTRGARR